MRSNITHPIKSVFEDGMQADPTASMRERDNSISCIPQGKGVVPQPPSFPSHRPWVRLGSLLALTGYISQIACQFLIVSGLWLAQASPLSAMQEESLNPYHRSNHDYCYTDEDIETCISAIIAHSAELERAPGSTYLLKPKGTEHLPFRNQAGKPYYAALLPSCSCVAEAHNLMMGIPALPVTYCLDKDNQKGEFVLLLEELLNYDDAASMAAYLTHREQSTGANYKDFKSIIEASREEIDKGGDSDNVVAGIKSQLRNKLSFYRRLAKDVFDELLFHTSKLSNTCYKIVFPFCQNNAHWHVGEIWGEKNGINNYSFTVISHDPYGGGNFSETFSEDAVQIRECLAHRLSLPHLALTPAISPYAASRQSDSVSCGPIMIDDLFKVILDQSLNVPKPYGYGAIPLRRQQVEMIKAVQYIHGTPTLVSVAEANKFVQKNTQWVMELEGLPQNRGNRENKQDILIKGIVSNLQTSLSAPSVPGQEKTGGGLPPANVRPIPLISERNSIFPGLGANASTSVDKSGFYRDTSHPLTHEFWKGKDLSDRLRQIRSDVEKLKDVLTRDKKGPSENSGHFTEEDRERYCDILRCLPCMDNPVQEFLGMHYKMEGFLNLDNPKIVGNGLSGNEVMVLTHNGSSLIAIKKFENTQAKPDSIKEGLEELLYSLVAHNINPYPSKLKMARIYDAVLCPKNSLSLIMEGANTYDIHYFLATSLAEDAVRACAHYLAMFHIGNYKNGHQNINREDYLRHKAESYHKTSYNPLREQDELSLRVGKQQSGPVDVTARNIIRLLPREEQRKFASLVERNRKSFEENCSEIFRSFDPNHIENRGSYFLTKTHGDAHGNNFFYNNDKGLRYNRTQIRKDSFYRITMIDFASIIKTYGDIGDPAEDVGRFLGSLWDWAARPGYRGYKAYGRIHFLQDQFLETYLQRITDEKIFSNNGFYPPKLSEF